MIWDKSMDLVEAHIQARLCWLEKQLLLFLSQRVMVMNTNIALSTLREVLFSWNTGICQQPFSRILRRQDYSSNQVARRLSAQCWKYRMIRSKHFASINKDFMLVSMIIHSDWSYECNSGRSEMSLAATMQIRIQVCIAAGVSAGKMSGL
jgi:hypothetical protein